MDYSASEQKLADELKATKVRVQDLELQIEDLSDRIGNIASQLGKLTKVIKQMMTNGVAQPAAAATDQYSSTSGEVPPPARSANVSAVSSTMDLPVELLQAIKMITEGHSEEAQKLITAQPREILAANPGIVALVAGAVRIRKGEFEIAAAALQKARSLLNDPRLLRVVKFMEAQLPG